MFLQPHDDNVHVTSPCEMREHPCSRDDKVRKYLPTKPATRNGAGNASKALYPKDQQPEAVKPENLVPKHSQPENPP